MIAYENSNELCITLPVDNTVSAGMFCNIDEAGNVVAAEGGSPFIGKVKTVRNGLACVAVRGIMEANTEGMTCGRKELLAEGDSVFEMSGGTLVTVLHADQNTGRCIILL